MPFPIEVKSTMNARIMDYPFPNMYLTLCSEKSVQVHVTLLMKNEQRRHITSLTAPMTPAKTGKFNEEKPNIIDFSFHPGTTSQEKTDQVNSLVKNLTKNGVGGSVSACKEMIRGVIQKRKKKRTKIIDDLGDAVEVNDFVERNNALAPYSRALE